MAKTMKLFTALLFACMLGTAFAQPGRPHGPPGRGPQVQQHQMPPAERRMSWEDRQKLRDQVRSGQMTRDEARERWREERMRNGGEPRRSPEERERLRRDVYEANRDLPKR